MPPRTSAYRLTADLVTAHAGEQVLCLASAGIGRRWELYAERPGPEINTILVAALSPMADLIGGAEASEPPPVLRVDIRGPIDETAGFVSGPDPCSGGYVDGNDAICERLCAAFAEGDVLLCVNSPGGNPRGAPEGIRRALEAKAANGRRCVLHVEGTMASLGLWWGVCVADEVYAAPDAVLGSIGARGAHMSIAGALAMEGLVPTFSAWPDEGKLAGVAELPISELAKARNDRDVARIGEAFAAAVASSPMALRTGLTVDAIRALRADALTGSAALAAGLCDGIATLEDTAAWALESAGTGTGETMTIKAADEKPPKGDEAPESTKAPPGLTPQTACASCKMENAPEAKFCNQCGLSMAAAPVEDEEEPESTKRPEAQATRPRVTASGSALTSVPALRTALARSTTILDAVARMVGATSHAEILGGVEATAKDAGNAKRYREERNTARAKADVGERLDILARLYTADPKGHARGKLVVDVVENVDAAGRVVPAGDDKAKVTGSRVIGVKPAAQWGDGPEGRTLPNLRAYARSTLAGLPAAEASPFTKPPAEANAEAANGRVNDARVEAVKDAPAVRKAADSGVDPKVAAEIYARRFPAEGGAL